MSDRPLTDLEQAYLKIRMLEGERDHWRQQAEDMTRDPNGHIRAWLDSLGLLDENVNPWERQLRLSEAIEAIRAVHHG